MDAKTELLTVKEAARELSLAEVTLRQRIARRQIGVVLFTESLFRARDS